MKLGLFRKAEAESATAKPTPTVFEFADPEASVLVSVEFWSDVSEESVLSVEDPSPSVMKKTLEAIEALFPNSESIGVKLTTIFVSVLPASEAKIVKYALFCSPGTRVKFESLITT